MTANARPIPLEPFPDGEFTVTLFSRFADGDGDAYLVFSDDAGHGFVFPDIGAAWLNRPYNERTLTVETVGPNMRSVALEKPEDEEGFPLRVENVADIDFEDDRRLFEGLSKKLWSNPANLYPSAPPASDAPANASRQQRRAEERRKRKMH